jgi:RNA polymerase sigma-70 factor (ECF subfamily)
MNATDPYGEQPPLSSGGRNVHSREDRFLDFYNTAYPRLYAFILSLLPDRADAHDALQETSVVLLRRFDDFRFQPDGAEREVNAFIKWGCGIAFNQVRRLRRQRAQSLQFSDQVLDRIAVARQRHSDLLESRRRFLPECVGKLVDSDRNLLFRCVDTTTTIKAVAEQLDRPVNTVYKALTRIRATLKTCIDLAVRREERP